MGVFFRGGSFLALDHTIPRRKFSIFVPVPQQVLDNILEDGVCIRDFSVCHFCLNAFLTHTFKSSKITSPNMVVVLLHPLHPHLIYWPDICLADISLALPSDVINNSTIKYSTTENIGRRHHHSAMVYITCHMSI